MSKGDIIRTVKCGVSLCLYVFTTFRDGTIRLFGGVPKGSCVILNYHSVPAEERVRFGQQMEAVVRHARPVSVAETHLRIPGKHCVGVTFDDGFENFISQAMPEMSSRNIPSTVFMIVDALGNDFGTPELLEKVMTLEEMLQIPQELVTLGSHTVTHPYLPLLSDAEAYQELLDSRLMLENMLGRPVPLFAFPFGGFTENLVRLAQKAGYQRVFTTLPYLACRKGDEFAVGRIRVDPSDWTIEFRLKMAGAYRWLPRAYDLKKALLGNKFMSAVFRSMKKTAPGHRIPHALIRKTVNTVTV